MSNIVIHPSEDPKPPLDAQNAPPHLICTIYLLRTTHPEADFERFFIAFARYTEPHSCHLCVVIKGDLSTEQAEFLEKWRARLQANHPLTLYPVPDDGYDITAYAAAARHLREPFVCFCNTYSEPLVDGWLKKLAHPVLMGEAGLSGASASYENSSQERRFPNPNIRTNAFFLTRALFLDLTRINVTNRKTALAFECGRNSMTRQVLASGLRVVVVNGSGEAFDVARAHEAKAFRTLGPQNLLVADNRTRAYDEADEALKAKLRRFAWQGKPKRWHRFYETLWAKFKRLLGAPPTKDYIN